MILEKEHITQKSIDLGFAVVTLRNDGIVNTQITITDSVDLDQAKLLLKAYLDITDKTKTPHLFTPTKFVIMDKEVMAFVKNEANKYGKADAFVIQSLPQKIIGNFYLKVVKPSVPTRLFNSEDEAVEWLRGYLD